MHSHKISFLHSLPYNRRRSTIKCSCNHRFNTAEIYRSSRFTLIYVLAYKLDCFWHIFSSCICSPVFCIRQKNIYKINALPYEFPYRWFSYSGSYLFVVCCLHFYLGNKLKINSVCRVAVLMRTWGIKQQSL